MKRQQGSEGSEQMTMGITKMRCGVERYKYKTQHRKD